MELDSTSIENQLIKSRDPRPNTHLDREDDDDVLCQSSSHGKPGGDDSEDEKESLSSSISSGDSTSEDSDICTTDSSEPSSPVTCIPWADRTTTQNQKDRNVVFSPTAKTGESSLAMPIHMDRKRKEHDENSSFREDHKIIRSVEPDERQNSDKDNGAKNIGLSEGENVGKNEIQTDYVNTVLIVSRFGDEKNFGNSATSEPRTDADYGMRSVPTSFEPELQRQWERTAAQWQSRKLCRTHRPRHYARSAKSFSEAEEAIRHKHCNIGGLKISPSKPSSSISVSDASQDSFEFADETDQLTTSISEDDESNQLILSSVKLEPLPQLDLSTLHHQMESEAPVSLSRRSSDQVMLSPRNSITLTEDYAIPPSPPIHQLPIDPPLSRQILDGNQESKIQLLSRQIFNWKKQLKSLEKEHLQVFGYKPSHADKINHREMRKCLQHINKAKQELKQIREDPSAVSGVDSEPKVLQGPMSLKELENTVTEVQNALTEDRKFHSRPEDLLLMNSAELVTEKGIMQKQLLLLEKRHGRPTNKEEKEIVRKLYERYRVIKKMSNRCSTVKENSLDLVPILEHETLDLNTENEGGNSPMPPFTETKRSPRALRRRLAGSSRSQIADDVSIYIEYQNHDYNDMELNELERHYKIASEEKRRLRSALRAIEPETQGTTSGQKRDDKYSTVESEMMHQKYKHTRATLRLLDVLINKRKYPSLVQDVRKH